MTLTVDEQTKNSFPDEVQRYVAGVGGKAYGVQIQQWSFGELNVPPYPEPRIYKRIGAYVCSFNGSGIISLTIHDRKHTLSGVGQSQMLSCKDLKQKIPQ